MYIAITSIGGAIQNFIKNMDWRIFLQSQSTVPHYVIPVQAGIHLAERATHAYYYSYFNLDPRLRRDEAGRGSYIRATRDYIRFIICKLISSELPRYAAYDVWCERLLCH